MIKLTRSRSLKALHIKAERAIASRQGLNQLEGKVIKLPLRVWEDVGKLVGYDEDEVSEFITQAIIAKHAHILRRQ